MAIEIPDNYGLVIGSVAVIAASMEYLGTLVVGERRKHGIKYPAMHTDDPTKQSFNRAQRGHHNALETVAVVLALALGVGLFYPRLVAALNVFWAASRVQFARGYLVAPDNRYNNIGGVHHLVRAVYFLLAIWLGISELKYLF